MNWLDIIFITVLLFSTVLSFRKGFSREVIGLAASIFALVLAMWFYGLAGSFVAPYVDSARVANLLGFILVVVAVLLGGAILSWIVNRFLRTIGLSFFDRLLGAVFGLARGLLVVIAVLTAFMAFGAHAGTDNTPSSVVNSKLAPYVLEASRFAVAIAPMDLKQSFRKYYSKVQSAVAERAPKHTEKEF
ncbi:MAG: rane protein required for colicin production [Bryobacterales bacterium]|nr:rane protein required for colicin production [Bryobacterales bacterium]